MNRIILIGNLTRDGELRTMQSGTEVFNFTLAVRRDFKRDDGTFDVDYISCIAFNKTAENLAKFTQKGHKVGIEGRLQVSSYEKDDGSRTYKTDVVVDRFDLLTKKEDKEELNNHEVVAKVVNDDYDPFKEFADETAFDSGELPF